MKPILSILTPAVFSRLEKVKLLAEKIDRQGGMVEHLILYDNKKRTVGEKRDALLRASRGEYVAFVDDDDDISPDYVHEIIHAITHSKPVHSSNEKVREIVSQDAMPDVVTFNQKATVNGEVSTVEFRLGNPNEAFKPGGITKRNAWHICAWRRILAIQSWFPATNYGEDWSFAARLCAVDNLKEVHIERVLHYYNHSAATTEAPPPQ